MNRSHLLLTVATGLFALTAACSAEQPAPPAPKTSAAMTHNDLWGDMKPIVSVKELMRDFIDPASDYVFDSVSTVITKKGGIIEKFPKTDDDWDKVRFGAVMMAEGVYLLKVPRPFAPPGDENNSTGPDAPELSPAQITAKLEGDPVLWNAKIEALRNVGREVLEVVKKKDVNALFEAGGDLDEACESCHIEYWYPGEKVTMPEL